MQGFHTCPLIYSDGFTNFPFFFFFFTIVLTLDSFFSKWATTAAHLNLWYIPSNSVFSCNDTTLLCFLGALPTSPAALPMGPLMFFRSLWYCTKHQKNMWELQEVTFLLRYVILLVRRTGINITQCFKQYSIWARHNNNRWWLQDYYSSTICTFMQLFNPASLHLFTFQLQMAPYTVSVCINFDKFNFL